MTALQALLLSVIEGITEFLPISSTGHLVLASTLLHIQQTEFVKSFEIIIQLGAILAIVFLYRKRILDHSLAMWTRIFVAFLPTAILGFTLYKIVKQLLIGNSAVTLWALFLGGIALIALELLLKDRSVIARSPRRGNLTAPEKTDSHGPPKAALGMTIDRIEQLTIPQCLFIGLAQSLSMIPGVSRAAATIIGARLAGASRKMAVEFSFLLAIPTMAAATGLDVIKTSAAFTPNDIVLLAIGFLGSFVVAVIAVKWFVAFVQHHSFIPFGIYRILLALSFWFFVR